MSLPFDVLSTSDVVADFLIPADRGREEWKAYEMGGIALDDPSQGHLVKIWVVEYIEETGDVLIYSEDGIQPPLLLFTLLGIGTLSLAFDQNMRPAVTYNSGADIFLYWYDNVEGDYTITNVGVGSWPTLTLDDKRLLSTAGGISDILMFYLLEGNLAMRRQRDRFLTIFQLTTTGGYEYIERCGMMTNYRIGIDAKPAIYLPICKDFATK